MTGGLILKRIKLWKEDRIPFFSCEYDGEENIDTSSITPYTINDDKVHPCVIVVPGGGYTHRAQHEGEPIALWLNDRGISAFVVDYRVEPYCYPAPIVDIKRAIKFVRYNSKKFMINPDKIGIMGFSAGAHAACCAAEFYDENEYPPADEIDNVSARPNICVFCYPVITMKDEFCHAGSKERILKNNSLLEKKLSCEENIRDDMPPVFLWHTFEDKSVPVRNSLEMAISLKEKEIPFELHIYPNGRHGLGMTKCVNIEGTNKWVDALENWLKRNGF